MIYTADKPHQSAAGNTLVFLTSSPTNKPISFCLDHLELLANVFLPQDFKPEALSLQWTPFIVWITQNWASVVVNHDWALDYGLENVNGLFKAVMMCLKGLVHFQDKSFLIIYSPHSHLKCSGLSLSVKDIKVFEENIFLHIMDSKRFKRLYTIPAKK